MKFLILLRRTDGAKKKQTDMPKNKTNIVYVILFSVQKWNELFTVLNRK